MPRFPPAALCLAIALCPSPMLAADEIVFSASRANAPPLLFYEQDRLTGGLLKDLGEAIAEQLKRQARFLALPRKRIEQYLASGEIDAHCYSRPDWYPNPRLLWSRPLIADSDLVISIAGAPVLRSFEDLKGKKVGTVLGFHYKNLERHQELGILRDDAPSMEHNLRKLATGRFDYAFTNRLSLDYYQKIGDPPLKLHPPLVLERYQTYCALSPKSRIALKDFNHALDTLHKSGHIDRILARYR